MVAAAAAVRRVVLAEEDEERRRSHTTTSKMTTAAVSTGRADAVGEAAAVAVTDAVAAMVDVVCLCFYEWVVLVCGRLIMYMGGKGSGDKSRQQLEAGRCVVRAAVKFAT